jgi:hypothetical protein
MYRRIKSLEAIKFQKQKETEWLSEDKKMLNLSITIKDLDRFVSGDLEIIEVDSEKSLKQGNNIQNLDELNKSVNGIKL